ALARDGLLAAGEHVVGRWWRDGNTVVSVELAVPAGAGPPTELALTYRERARGGAWCGETEAVGLAWTPCHYGGRRPWLVCPRPAARRPAARSRPPRGPAPRRGRAAPAASARRPSAGDTAAARPGPR